jgi:deoxyribonuclease V
VKINKLHQWVIDTQEALEIQRQLSGKIIQYVENLSPHFIAGLDVSTNRNSEGIAGAVVLTYPGLDIIETSVVKGKVKFPYLPGLLSFREMPLMVEALEKLLTIPDLVLIDGHGISHPRRLGLASHIGLFLDIPTIGCAKSLLYGSYSEPDMPIGSNSNIVNTGGEIIGAVLRTKTNVKPLFISIGNKIDLAQAIFWVSKCCRGYRLPEPTRLAHLVSKGIL